jgi:hypothetical protein
MPVMSEDFHHQQVSRASFLLCELIAILSNALLERILG